MFKNSSRLIQYQVADSVVLIRPSGQASLCEVISPVSVGIRPLDTLLDLNDYSLPACRNHPEVSASSGSTNWAIVGINCNLYQ